jgi:hypothetical protein
MCKTFNRTCAECNEAFTAKDRRAEFCGSKCRLAMNNRRRDRGAQLLDLYVHTRFNRKAAQERNLQTIIDRMVGNWIAEDRAAGRREMRPLDDVMFQAVQHVATTHSHRAGK